MSRETCWCVDFYDHRCGLIARYDVEAPSPAAAVAAGRQTRLEQYPAAAPRRRLSLFERAERFGGEDGSGWILYRIARLTRLQLTASSIAFADVPRPQDIAACNEEAKEAPENPQLEGMDPERSGDLTYQATYRACMRKAGF